MDRTPCRNRRELVSAESDACRALPPLVHRLHGAGGDESIHPSNRRALQIIGARDPRPGEEDPRHKGDAWDAVHDVFLKLLERPDVFRGEAELKTFVWRMTTNHCLNLHRDEDRRSRANDGLCAANEPRCSSIEERADARRTLVKLAEAITGGRVPNPERVLETAIRKYVDELSQEEIASTMSVSRKTVQRDLALLSSLAERAR